MAKTKTKPKTKKPASRKAASPGIVIPSHRFAPGTKVAFLPAHVVSVERSIGREPMATPTETVTVKADGTLEVKGLQKGTWCAAGMVGDRWCYAQFSVK